MKTLFTFLAIISTIQLYSQEKISNVRNLQGEQVTVSGIVTNGEELGAIRYFQDETAGLAMYGNLVQNVKRGDSVTVTGTLKNYNNLLELDPVKSVTVHSSNHQLPMPKIITLDEMSEEYESRLVQIKNVEFVDASGTFSGGTNYEIMAGNATAELRIDRNAPIVGEVIPTGTFSLTAILSQYSPNDPNTGYQLLPRDMNDFKSANPVNITSPVMVSEITTNGFALLWETDVDATSEVRFGTTPNQSSWEYIKSEIALTAENAFLHKAYISGLEPAAIVYAQPFSVFDSDTAFSSTGIYATKSKSSGKINVYFNTAVNQSVSTGTIAQNISTFIEDTLIAYINRAEESIDFCVYNINNNGISNVSEALNAAKNRGVKIRFITSGSTAHVGVRDLNDNIPVLESPNGENDGIMHNKFAIFDANAGNPDKSWIWTGSTNLTYDQVNTDANNSLFIQDQTLAKAYQIEFEEMWGSTGDLPDETKAKFGAEKKDNTPHQFIIGDIPVECYFSPSDNTNQKIIDAIGTAGNDLEVETMVITRTDLALAIAAANQRGVTVHVITNEQGENTETVNNILNDNLPVTRFVFDYNVEGLLHNKMAVIDANLPSSDPQVITGSHNWSNSANERNDENTLIIHSAEIANIYFQQFAQRFVENGGNLNVVAEYPETSRIKIYPNPVNNRLEIYSSKQISTVQLFTILGKKVTVKNNVNDNNIILDLSHLQPGLYFLQVNGSGNDRSTFKVVKNR